MIDININAIISQALAAAVQQATAPLLERIATLESQSAALLNRVAALEKRVFEDLGTIIEQEFIASMAVTDVVGHDTVKALTDRVAALESTSTQSIGVLLENLDNQEWFWHKIREFTGTVVEQAVEHHCDEYDHNDFVTEDKLDDYVKTENLESEVCDAVRDIMEGARVSIRI
jgi:hypothetical protein